MNKQDWGVGSVGVLSWVPTVRRSDSLCERPEVGNTLGGLEESPPGAFLKHGSALLP